MQDLHRDTYYDLVIIGTGPAGLTAGLYASRYRLKTLAIGQIDGGLITESHKVCNFPTEQSISGFELSEKMKNNALSQGVIFKNGEAVSISRKDDFEITLLGGEKYFAKAVLLATGTIHRKLGLEKEKQLVGRGLSYCATCDGMFFRNKTVAVVGGNDSAVTSALYLSEIAQKVFLIYRGKELRAEPSWLDKISLKPNIEVIAETNIVEFLGQEKLEGVELDRAYKNQSKLGLDGLFIEIGSEPKYYDFMRELDIEVDSGNFIKVDAGQRTSSSGVWAAGDATTASNKFRQVITACAEGAVAAQDIFNFIQSK